MNVGGVLPRLRGKFGKSADLSTGETLGGGGTCAPAQLIIATDSRGDFFALLGGGAVHPDRGERAAEAGY